jgi:HlyD family secretion protein
MAGEKGIFRQKALDRLSSPESLDQLMRVSSARDWIALLALGFVAGTALLWSIFGTLPTSVSGRGVFIRPAHVVDSQSVGAGRLEMLRIKAGDIINKGDILGRLDQSDLHKQLEQDRALVADLQAQDKAKTDLQHEQQRLRNSHDGSQRAFLELQRQSLTQSLQDSERLAPLLKRRFGSLDGLKKEGLIAEVSPELLQAEQALLENDAKATDLRARLQQVEGQIKQLDTDVNTLARDSLESATSRKNQIRDVLTRIAVNEVNLRRNSEIVSEHSGRVLEVIAYAGQFVTAGARIATVELDDASQPLVTIGYFPVRDGKKIQPGMAVQVTPDTVERERYGGIIGTVSSVSALPVTKEGAMAVIGNADVVGGLMGAGPYIAVTAQLQSDGKTFSGYAWSSSKGPQTAMSPGLTGTVRTTIEQRAPITYVLPFLRSLSGIH